MQAKSLLRIVALLFAVALAGPAMAKPVSKDLNLPTKAKIGSTVLEAGSYKCLVDGTTITIKQDNRVVAQVEGQWEPRDKKHRYTSVLRGPNGEVQEIRFEGERRTLVVHGQ